MLKQPNTRAKYLLSLHGIDVFSETSETQLNPVILMEIMEIR